MKSFTITDKLSGIYLSSVEAETKTEALNIFTGNTIYQEHELDVTEFKFEPVR